MQQSYRYRCSLNDSRRCSIGFPQVPDFWMLPGRTARRPARCNHNLEL